MQERERQVRITERERDGEITVTMRMRGNEPRDNLPNIMVESASSSDQSSNTENEFSAF